MSWLTKPRRWFPIYLGLAAGLVAVYLLTSGLGGELGFPLDDAWIHQTYARNFAESGRWEYVRGESSAGSTAPLWTLMIAAGYWPGLSYTWWTWGLGVLSLALTAWAAQSLTSRLYPEPELSWLPPAVGLLCLGEWHLVWAAASGMETTLFAALSLALMAQAAAVFSETERMVLARWAGVGVLAGLLVLTRPEGVILIALIGLLGTGLLAGRAWPWRDFPRAMAAAGLGAGALLLPYLLFNLNLSGRLWPNTYYAKQAEYAAELAAPWLVRLGRVSLPPLTGFQILLVPGLVLSLARLGPRAGRGDPRKLLKTLLAALPLTYGVAHLLLYALRLPVVYQHGRYLIPAIPAIILSGAGGTARWFAALRPGRGRRVIGRSWTVATLALLLAFYALGARSFGQDVRFIQGEMVAGAHWLAENTEPDAPVAAHDIGAIGYFAGRPMLDLAGLISNEVVPLMGREVELADYVLDSPAQYLVTAPGWPYDRLTGSKGVSLVFSTDFQWTVEMGMNNSAIYRLPDRESR